MSDADWRPGPDDVGRSFEWTYRADDGRHRVSGTLQEIGTGDGRRYYLIDHQPPSVNLDTGAEASGLGPTLALTDVQIISVRAE